MKLISIIMILASLVFGEKKMTLKVDMLKKTLSEVQEIDAFFDELNPLFEKPMSWCEVSPSGEFGVEKINDKESYLKIESELICDETWANKMFSNIINRYKTTILNNEQIIDSEMKVRYPYLTLSWGEEFMQFKAYVTYNKEYSKENQYAQRLVYYKLIINSRFESPTISKFKLHGNILTTGRNLIDGGKFKKKQIDTYRVYTKTLEEYNPTIEFKQLYVLDETTIK